MSVSRAVTQTPEETADISTQAQFPVLAKREAVTSHAVRWLSLRRAGWLPDPFCLWGGGQGGWHSFSSRGCRIRNRAG